MRGWSPRQAAVGWGQGLFMYGLASVLYIVTLYIGLSQVSL